VPGPPHVFHVTVSAAGTQAETPSWGGAIAQFWRRGDEDDAEFYALAPASSRSEDAGAWHSTFCHVPRTMIPG
jgi:hypothetical protein